jgi:putative heme iron utilization protein
MFWADASALIRRSRTVSLASHSVQLPGYPHVSWLPMVADQAARPMLIISRLAEHTQNILQDNRVSVLLHDADMGLNQARLTILGQLHPVSLDELLVARLARYNSELAACLQMSDFSVWRISPQRARYIAGFGKMGWLEAESWDTAFALSSAQEAQLLQQYAGSAPFELVGIDAGGCDLRCDQQIKRYPLPQAASSLEALKPALEQLLQGI